MTLEATNRELDEQLELYEKNLASARQHDPEWVTKHGGTLFHVASGESFTLGCKTCGSFLRWSGSYWEHQPSPMPATHG